MQSIILAAGMGSRLGSLTAENTKCNDRKKTDNDRILKLLKIFKIG